MKTLIALLLMCSVCWAETINEKYSYKAFPYHGVSFKDKDPKEFNDTVIVGTCFYQECIEGEVVKDIFPDGMKGVTFRKCNLDNIKVPDGNIAEGGCNRRIKIQNDLGDWVLDKDLKPVEPMDKEMRIEKGISVNPKDIPITKQDKNVFEKTAISISD